MCAQSNNHGVRHRKVPGFIVDIDTGMRWWARLTIDGIDYEAEMTEPLPDHAEVGSYFTIHTTKRGKTYLYWITTRWPKRQIKKAKRAADDLMRALEWA